MQEELVKFKTAKLAKEVGFSVKDNYLYKWYNELGELRQWMYLQTNESAEFIAPTQSLLQKWLREKHNLHILLNTSINTNGKVTFYCNTIKFGKNLYKSMFRSKSLIYTYEEALEVGLYEGLKLIKDLK